MLCYHIFAFSVLQKIVKDMAVQTRPGFFLEHHVFRCRELVSRDLNVE